MTNFEKLKNMTIEELAKFIDEHGMYDDTPWMNWWDETYCDSCPGLKLTCEEAQETLGITPFMKETYECAYCEVYHKCKYFPDQEEVPSMQDIVKLWLEAEADGKVLG